ncbi:MAG: hypothetical protein KAR87_01215 [Candidatus Aenigmarchaeota archaeon]|nr:hypothetical protein [Candidatus Aenigmarchaeota archaeon]
MSLNREFSFKNDEAFNMMRGNEMSYFVEGVFNDVERSFEISGKLAVIAITNYELANGTFINNSNISLVTAMRNGTYNSTQLPFIENATLDDWHNSVKKMAENLNFDFNIHVYDLEIKQEDNFHLNITSFSNFLIIDPILNALLDRNKTISKIIEINRLEDPFNTISSKGYIYQPYMPCDYLEGDSSSVDWKYGRSYVDFATTDFSLFPPFPVDTILITKNISEVDNFGVGLFVGVIGETKDTTVAIDYIASVSNATDFILDDSIIVMDGNKTWMTNLITETNHSCFFEAKGAPCFFERIENISTFSSKYLPGDRGIGSFINLMYFPDPMKNPTAEGIDDYKLDWKYYPV